MAGQPEQLPLCQLVAMPLLLVLLLVVTLLWPLVPQASLGQRQHHLQELLQQQQLSHQAAELARSSLSALWLPGVLALLGLEPCWCQVLGLGRLHRHHRQQQPRQSVHLLPPWVRVQLLLSRRALEQPARLVLR